jgi:hypothetical protein
MKMVLLKFYRAASLALKDLYISTLNAVERRPKTNRPASVALYCCEADRGFEYKGKKYSQILDSYIQLVLKEHGIIYTIGPPGTGVKSKSFFCNFFGPSPFYAAVFFVATLIDSISLGRLNARYRADSIRYRGLLRSLKCNILIGIQPPVTLIKACISENVKVFDIQHGDISPGIPYYEDIGRNFHHLNFIVWDHVTAKMMERHFCADPSRITVSGHPWITFFNARAASGEEFFTNQLKSARDLFANDTNKRVLVTLQYGLDKLYPEYFDNEYLPKSLIEAINERRDVAWCLRLHPVVSRTHSSLQKIIELVTNHPGVTLHHPHDIALPALLHFTDLHITWHSSSVIEAINFGIPNMVLCKLPYNYGVSALGSVASQFQPYEQYSNSNLVYWPNDLDLSLKNEILKFIDCKRGKNEQLHQNIQI